jgi:hypothetical protein
LQNKLIFGILLCFCFEASALACNDNQLEIVESNSSRYKVGRCLHEEDKLVLKNKKECIVLKSNKCIKTTKKCVKTTKKCGPYPKKDDKGFIERLIELLKQRVIADSYHCDIWDIGSMQNIMFCLFKYPSNKISFYQIDINSPDSLTIRDEKNKKSHAHDGQPNEKNLQWLFNQLPIQVQKRENSFTKKQMADRIWEYLNKSDRKLERQCQ